MSNNWEELKKAVEEVKKRVRSANAKYFDTYEVIHQLFQQNRGKYYAQLLSQYQDNDHPFGQANVVIGKQMLNMADELGIQKVQDAETGEDIKVYVSENVVGGYSKVQLWKIID
ncbi:hypothetical protein J7K99_02965 [bacterium]|nr:hypothetical protein [bacterium]